MGLEAKGLLHGQGIIAIDKRLCPELVQIVNKVVGEAVIVIDNQDHSIVSRSPDLGRKPEDGPFGLGLLWIATIFAGGDALVMSSSDSALDNDQIALAKVLLQTPAAPTRTWAPLSAAAIAAVTALVFATASLLVPASEGRHVVQSSR